MNPNLKNLLESESIIKRKDAFIISIPKLGEYYLFLNAKDKKCFEISYETANLISKRKRIPIFYLGTDKGYPLWEEFYKFDRSTSTEYLSNHFSKNKLLGLKLYVKFLIDQFLTLIRYLLSRKFRIQLFKKDEKKWHISTLIQTFFNLGDIYEKALDLIENEYKEKGIEIKREDILLTRKKVNFAFNMKYLVSIVSLWKYNRKQKIHMDDVVYFLFDIQLMKLYSFTFKEMNDYSFIDLGHGVAAIGAINDFANSKELKYDYVNKEVKIEDEYDLYLYCNKIENNK